MMRAIPDLVLMSELSESEMYNVLTRRLKEKRIYTYIGDVLISVNPYTQLPIYGAERINEHKGQLACEYFAEVMECFLSEASQTTWSRTCMPLRRTCIGS
jgi:hypothetical protein